jgi:ankyrin repeat protein
MPPAPQYSTAAPQAQYYVELPAYSPMPFQTEQQQLADAIKAGDVNTVKGLLQDVNIRKRINELFESKTFLYLAAETKHAQIVQLLVEAGADPRVTDPDNRNALFAAFSVESNADTILYLLSLDSYQHTLITELAAVQNGFRVTPFITTIANGHEQNVLAALNSPYARKLLELSIGNDPQSTDVDTPGKVANRLLAYYTQRSEGQAIQKYQRILSSLKSNISTLNSIALSAVGRTSTEDLTPATMDEKNEAIQSRLYNLVLDENIKEIGRFLEQQQAAHYINEPILESVMASENKQLKDLFLTFFASGLEDSSLKGFLKIATQHSNRQFSTNLNALLNPVPVAAPSTSSLVTRQYAAPVAQPAPVNSTYSMTPVQLVNTMSEFSFAPPPVPRRNLYAEVRALPNTNNNEFPNSSQAESEKKPKTRQFEPA